MLDEHAVCMLVTALLPHLRGTRLVLDAAAMGVVCSEASYRDVTASQANDVRGDMDWHLRGSFAVPVLLTPHAAEMAHLTGRSKAEILDAPGAWASDYAKKWRAVVALKGATTFIASSDGSLWRHDADNAGLVAPGSGDVLAGLMVGLLARGASLKQAAAWGVALHARADEELARQAGPQGYPAHDIADRVSELMQRLAAPAI